MEQDIKEIKDELSQIRKRLPKSDWETLKKERRIYAAAGFVIAALLIWLLTPSGESHWNKIRSLQKDGKFQEAAECSLVYIKERPTDPQSYTDVAKLFLLASDLKTSKDYFAKAYELFPDKENTDKLQAIEKRIELESRK